LYFPTNVTVGQNNEHTFCTAKKYYLITFPFFFSRWLKSVNSLLENLDSGVGNVVENLEDMEDEDEVGGQSSVDDILAKRGLLAADLSHDDDEEDVNNDEEDNDKEEIMDFIEEENEHDLETDSSSPDYANFDATGDDPGDQEEGYVNEGDEVTNNQVNDGRNAVNETFDTAFDQSFDQVQITKEKDVLDAQKDASEEQSQEDDLQTQVADLDQNNDAEDEDEENLIDVSIQDQPIAHTTPGTKPDQKQPNAGPPTSPIRNVLPASTEKRDILLAEFSNLKQGLEAQKKLTKDANSEKSNAVKETRKLRRNLVKLNAELDSAERELEAQRTELERAAARIEKDRQRYKEEKERTELGHKEDLKAIADEHKKSLQGMADAHANQIHDMEDRIERAEEARMQEGGDMSAELAEAAERERDTLKKAIMFEEEKSTFVSQVSSLKTQLVGSESRIESLQQVAECATEQEREADDRLDAALSLHARQLSQRQAREAELERTVADLGAALVAARARETEMSKYSNGNPEIGNANAIAELRDKLLSAKDEVELLSNQLMIERQQAETFQEELQDMTEEQAQETADAIAREKVYDLRVSELSSTISHLQSKQCLSKQSNSGNVGESSSETNAVAQKLQKQVSVLSEDLIRQKSKQQNSSTEIQTLRNRLKSALSRAEIAEKAAQAHAFDIESNQYSNGARRMNGMRQRNTVTSMKSAFKLDTGEGEIKESIGKVVDTIDIIAVDLGSYFRSDPFSRAFFLLYLMILHLWAFCLVIFHAHGTLEPSSDIGPDQLLTNSYRHIEQTGIP
jgi:hypothetical protein